MMALEMPGRLMGGRSCRLFAGLGVSLASAALSLLCGMKLGATGSARLLLTFAIVGLHFHRDGAVTVTQIRAGRRPITHSP